MRRVLIVIAAAVVVAVGAIVFVVMPDDDDDGSSESAARFRAIERTYVSGTHRLELAGADVGSIKVASPGGAYGEVFNKAISKVGYDDIVVEVNGAIGRGLVDWMVATLNGGSAAPRATGAINSYDGKGSVITRNIFTNALLKAIEVPACDALTNTPTGFRLTIAPASQTTQGGAGAAAAPAPSASKQLMSANCRLTIPGIDASKVSKIEGLSMTMPIDDAEAADPGGRHAFTKIQNGPIRITDLRAELSQSSAAPWNAWFTDLVINNNAANEKSAKIEWLDAALTGVLATADLGGCGVFKLRPVPSADPNAISKTAADVYCGTLALKL